MTNKIEASINVKVKASFLKIVEVSTGFGFSLENETKQERETTNEIERKWSFDVCVPPYTKLMATSFIGMAIIDLPYTGTMRITCKNGSVLQYNFNGTFNGATYSTADLKGLCRRAHDYVKCMVRYNLNKQFDPTMHTLRAYLWLCDNKIGSFSNDHSGVAL